MTVPSMECWVPASPKAPFWIQIRTLVESLRRYGGRAAARAPLTVVFGPEASPEEISRQMAWGKALGVRWEVVPEAIFARHGIYGTALQRFSGHFAADMVLMLDADVLITGSLDGLLRDTQARQVLRGLPAHIPPWTQPEQWDHLFAALQLGPAPKICTPSGRGIYPESAQDMPPYFNLGVILAPAAMMTSIGSVIFAEMAAIDLVMNSHYRCQLALMAAICRLGTPWRALPLRYNFPNDAAFVHRHPWEGLHIRMLHYLRRGPPCDRERDFASIEALCSWLEWDDLEGANRFLQRRIRALAPRQWGQW